VLKLMERGSRTSLLFDLLAANVRNRTRSWAIFARSFPIHVAEERLARFSRNINYRSRESRRRSSPSRAHDLGGRQKNPSGVYTGMWPRTDGMRNLSDLGQALRSGL